MSFYVLHEIIFQFALVYHTNGNDLLVLPGCLHRPARLKRNMQLLMSVHLSNKSSAPHGPLLFCRKPGIQYGETSKGDGYLLGSLRRGLERFLFFFPALLIQVTVVPVVFDTVLQSPCKFLRFWWVEKLPSTELG